MSEKKFPCPCCGALTISKPGRHEICHCNWQDDPPTRDDPDYKGGANVMSLNEAREAFKKGLPVD